MCPPFLSKAAPDHTETAEAKSYEPNVAALARRLTGPRDQDLGTWVTNTSGGGLGSTTYTANTLRNT